jgi:cation diffusion facilitator family transporter
VLVGLGIGWRGIDSIANPTHIDPEAITLVFAGLAIVAKEWLYRYTLRAARSVHSSMLEANAWHHRSDALSSIVVLAGISAQLMGVPYMDAAAAVIVALMVCQIGLRLAFKALSELIDTSLDAELIRKVRDLMQAEFSVVGVHNLRSRSMGGLGYLDAHIEVDSDLTVSEAHYIAHRIEHKVKKAYPQIIDVQIHIDPLDDKIRESVLARLPDRQVIEGDLAQAWDDNEARELIRQTRLHYLDELIEIDLVIEAASNTADRQAAIEQLRQRASELDYVGKVNLYFVN